MWLYQLLRKLFTLISCASPDRTVTTSFDTTPLTSTYLIAFIISDFKFVENSASSNIRHRVYANPIDYQNGQFSLGEGERLLNAIANYLNVPFTLPKMDQAAIPDFNAGGNDFNWEGRIFALLISAITAMENWGLVTYREEALLYNESAQVYPLKTRVVTTISHEFGHQWFG